MLLNEVQLSTGSSKTFTYKHEWKFLEWGPEFPS